MPGRQSAGSSARPNKNSAKRSRKRALDALSVAEHEVPHAARIPKNRVRELDRESDAPDRGLADDPDDLEPGRAAKRRRTATERSSNRKTEVVSDSDGNDIWVGGVGSDGDDSDLNSEEAFGESDEERYRGFRFQGSAAVGGKGEKNGGRKAGGKRVMADEVAQEAPVDWESEGDSEDRDVLSAPEEDDLQILHDGKFASMADGDRDEDDVSDYEAESVLSMSDIDDGTKDPGKLAKLQQLAASLAKEDSRSENRRPDFDRAQEAATPSQYGIRARQKLSIADLLPTVTDPQGRKALRMMMDDGQRSKEAQQGIQGKLNAPLPKRKQDRLDRAAAYEESRKTLNRWIDTVKHNRRAEHLVFPLPDPNADAAKSTSRLPPMTSSKPTTDLEATIQSILVESGMTSQHQTQDDEIQKAEELATHTMPLEEVQARRAELRRNRDLLFREEIRAKRIAKIKSKSYRRVHRKERERNLLRERDALVTAGIVPEDEQERLERMRAEERMSGRHRESRWAKSMKGVGRQEWDADARNDLTEMVRKNEELRRRIQGRDIRDGDSLSGSDEEDESLDEDDPEQEAIKTEKQLNRLHHDGQDEAASRLTSLKFMQRANTARKEQNDEAIKQMQKELRGDSATSDNEDMQNSGRQRYGPKPDLEQTTKEPPTSRNEFEEPEDLDDSDDVEIRISDVDPKSRTPPQRQANQHVPKQHENPPKQAPKPRKEKNAPKENPWLVPPKETRKSQSMAAEASVIFSNDFDNVEKENSRLAPERPSQPERAQEKQPSPKPTLDTSSSTQGPHTNVPDLSDDESNDSSFNGFSPAGSVADATITPVPSNAELIRQAFAADDVLAAQTFAAEKAALDAEDAAEDANESGSALPGWGAWTGVGLPKRDRRRPKPSINQATAESEKKGQKQGQQDAAPNVMISNKRVAKTTRYLASQLPRPFETKAQYERSLRLPVGREWVAGQTFREMVRPRVEVRAGEVVAPMSRPMM